MNIINNAADAMTGTLKVAAIPDPHKAKTGKQERIITINSRLLNGQVEITIKDTGPGIREEDIPRIFDPFYTRKRGMGMGIGLSICHDIIKDHKGSIEVENVKEGGTIFKIKLPVT